MEKPEGVPGSTPRRPRPTLTSARREAQRVADEIWAWKRLHETLHRIVNATRRGILL